MESLAQLIGEHLKSNAIFDKNAPWVVKTSNFGGRGLFANRDINAGEIIFKDNPLFVGPRSGTFSNTICAYCYEKADLRTCSKNCGLPVCSEKCENSIVHRNECQLILKWANGVKFTKLNPQMYKCLTPIRGLCLSDYQKELLKLLKDHQGKQHGFEVGVLKNELKLQISEKEENVLNMVCSLLDTNAFEIIMGDGENKSSLRGIYPLSSMMNHRCTPNTTYYFDLNQRMIVKAAVFIPKGQEIFHCYTKIFWATCVRQPYLLRTKHFYCTCARCQDPTEFGTNLSAINCLKCGGIVLPIFLKNLKMNWKCTLCNEIMSNEKAGIILAMLGSRLNSFGTSGAEEILNFLKRQLQKTAPACNQIAVQLKFRLVWILGHREKYFWSELSEDLLNEKESICRELLQLLTTLGAGQSKMRGLLLYELYCCLKERQRRFQLQEAGDHKSDFEEESKEMERLFQESRIILKEDVHAPLEIKNYNVVGSQTTLYNGHVFAA